MKLAALAVGAVMLVAACSDDDGDATETPTVGTTATATMEPIETPTDEPTDEPEETPTEAGTEEPSAEAVEITGVDYAFEGVPTTAEPGTTFTFSNSSESEAHELVLFQIPEGEERPIEELLLLPDEEAESIVGAPLGVAFAMPNEDGETVMGELTVEEPGRYVMLCFIPVGADPEVVAEAMQGAGEEAPDLGDGPPHFVEGMSAEFPVE
jgi:plastocyanin